MNRSQRKAVGTVTETVRQHCAEGRHADAIEYCRGVLAKQPDHQEACFQLGLTLAASGDEAGALAAYRRLIALNPRHGPAHNNIGVILQNQGDFDDALVWYRQAAALESGAADGTFNIAKLLFAQGKDEQAVKAFRKAVSVAPGRPQLRFHLGECLRSMGRHQESLAAFEQAIKLDPHYVRAVFAASMAQLMLGDLSGFERYEKRLIDFEPHGSAQPEGVLIAPSLRTVPRWQGQDLHGKRLLVWAEQGIGDSLMMLRYLPLLKARGMASLTVYCPTSLMAIMAGFADHVLSVAEPVDPAQFDMYCPMMSLPYVFGTRIDSIPPQSPWLQVPPAKAQRWASRLAPLRGLKVGLVWAGNRDFTHDALRSIALPTLAPLLRQKGVAWVGLQKGEAAGEVMQAAVPMVDWAFHCDDFMDTAALISQLDLVIGVDTAVVHLAGVLGKPVWLFNRFCSEWRWMTGRDDTPWYPTLRQFRQPALHDWASPIAQAADALAALAAGQPEMSEQEWAACIKACNAGPYRTVKKKGFFARWFGS